MTAINYPEDGEAGSAAVINRGLREALAALGLDPDDVSAPWLTSAGASALFAAIAHDHDDRYYLDSEVDTLLAAKANAVHTHDDRYYTEAEVDALVGGGGGGGGAAGGGEAWIHTDFEVWYAAQVGAQTAAAIAGNSLRAVPFVAPSRGGTLDRIAAEVTATSANNMRIGLYESKAEGNIYPGALLADSGDISTGTTGMKTHTISQALTAGRVYWLAWVASNTVSIRQFTGTSERERPLMGYPSTGIASGNPMQLVIAHAYAALPNPFTAAAARNAAQWPALMYRFSA